jgi:uncharacterized SAM-binding protein YcdF (DUF218 family)
VKRLLVRLFVSLGVLWATFTATPLVSWWAQWLSAGYSEQDDTVLVVLSGDSMSDTVIGYSTYLRCVYAFSYWQRHHVGRIILSGGPREHPIAVGMADFLASLGVPRDRMQLETSSTSTRENLAEVATLLQGDRYPVTLLTSDFHMRRALLLARRHHLVMAPHPVPDVIKRFSASRWEGPGLALQLTVETGKLAYEFLR